MFQTSISPEQLGLSLAGLILFIAAFYYLNNKINKLNDDTIKKTELLLHEKNCSRATAINEIVEKIFAEIKAINEKLYDLVSKS